MKIVWIGDWAQNGLGQIGTHVVPILAERGHDVTVLGTVTSTRQDTPFRIIPVSGQWVNGTWTDTYGTQSIARHVARIKPDAVLMSNEFWVCAPWLSLLSPRPPRVVYYGPIDTLQPPAALRATASGADRVLVYSDFAAQQLRAAGVEAEVCYLGVDERFVPGDKQAARVRLAKAGIALGDAFTIVNISGNDWKKDLPGLVLTFDLVRDARDARLVIVSRERDAVDLPNLRRLSRYPQDIFAIVNGESIPTEDIVTITQAADIAVYPYRGCGWGIPLVEAMACRVPVVTTDFSANAEIVSKGRGRAVPPLRRDVETRTVGWFATADPRATAQAVLAEPEPEQLDTAEAWARRLTWARTAAQIEAALCE